MRHYDHDHGRDMHTSADGSFSVEQTSVPSRSHVRQPDIVTPPRVVTRPVPGARQLSDSMVPDFDSGYFSHRREDRALLTQLGKDTLQSVTEDERADLQAGRQPYPVYDSHLEHHPGMPPNSYPFEDDFGRFAPVGMTFKEHLQYAMPSGSIGVEIGGPGRNLFRGFDPDVFSRTYGMTLVEPRSDEEKAADAEIGHTIIDGDFRKTWETLEKDLDGEKVNLVISRLVGGKVVQPYDPYALARDFDRAYAIVSDDRGLIYTSVPDILEPVIVPWAMKMQKEYDSTVGVDLHQNDLGFHLEVEKLPGAPKRLPLLDSREVMHHYNQAFAHRPKYIPLHEMVRRQHERIGHLKP